MENFTGLIRALNQIEVTDKKAKRYDFNAAIFYVVKKIKSASSKGGKIILIGNGGSASIASHLATDFLKNAKIPAMAFNDSSLLTCLSNDLGYSQVFAKPVEMLAKKGDVLFSISSSGKSKNILQATRKARDLGCFIVSLSSFKPDNPLKRMGDINFYVPSDSYGYAEITHLAICHYIADCLT